jgi:flavin reductase (DIM6/NTAB) family NADH-FMN oxidoreductase RutF
MTLDPSTTPPQDAYPFLVGVVNPRPIAWVLTRSPAGVLNLAPFSFFNVFGSNPPVLGFSPTLTRRGTEKDTLVNVRAAGECVVHVVTADARDAANLTSKELPTDESEVELAGLRTTPSTRVATPRLADAPVALECKLRQVVELGDGPIAGRLVLCDIVYLHVADTVLTDGKPDPHKLRTVGRLGGEWWCHTADLFKLPRP